MDLVLQREVEGKIFDAFVVVDLHLRGILIRLEVFDDIREPDRQAIIPGVRERESSVTPEDEEATRLKRHAVIHSKNWKSNCGNDGRLKSKTGEQPPPRFNLRLIPVFFFPLFFQSFPRLSL